ncbi:uncharacterized protein N7529_009940 [Penicillium soppii]|uniref:uncharacterized protein n=1 Tax=Penicillium soppii TaxID=69789 RepID=UPI002547C81A|nr:uncharacterized protein N7529_009940 [Penicillium soppii]KAJ5855996.1 hypothetical protein N7529_009940 [Penicillium soppii]
MHREQAAIPRHRVSTALNLVSSADPLIDIERPGVPTLNRVVGKLIGIKSTLPKGRTTNGIAPD